MDSAPIQTARNAPNRWERRQALARVIRVAVLVAPTALSLGFGLWMRRNLPPERLGLNPWLWLAGVLLGSVVIVIAAERISRRLTPLEVLLKMSLIFPDEAPSRFKIAMRTGTTRSLQRRIDEVRSTGQALDDESTYAEQMLELVAMLSHHDRLTRGHCERVRAYTDLLIEEMGIAEDDANKLRWAALLHDVGKLMVPYEILNKEGKPDADEWEILKSHTVEGQKLVKPLRDWLGPWALAVGEHHERWDGGGYPLGLAGEEIHLGGRIVAVADAYDVMTSARSYKKPLPAHVARKEIAECAGSQFDPEVARAFLNLGLRKVRWSTGFVAWLTSFPALQGGSVASVVSTATSTGGVVVASSVVAAGVGALPALPEVSASSDEALPAIIEVVGDSGPEVDEIVVVTTTTPDGAAFVAAPAADGVPEIQRERTAPTVTAAPLVVTSLPPSTTTSTTTTSTTTTSSTTPSTSTAPPPATTTAPPPATSTTTSTTSTSTTSTTTSTTTTSTTTTTLALLPPPTTTEPPAMADEEMQPRRGLMVIEEPAQDVVALPPPPSVSPFAMSVQEDGSASGVLEAVGSSLGATIVDQPDDGVLLVDGPMLVDGATHWELTYTPNPDYAGNDTFQAMVCDEMGQCSSSLLFIEVVPAPDDPVASDDLVSAVPFGQSTITVVALSNDTDPDGTDDLDPASVVVTPVTAGGTWTVSGGTIVFTPPVDGHGRFEATYEVCDFSGRCDTAGVDIEIDAPNQPPQIEDPGTVFTANGREVTIQIVATDADGDQLTFDAAGLPGGTSIDASGLISGVVASTLDAEHTVTVTVDDGEDAAQVDFTIDVAPVVASPVESELVISEVLFRTNQNREFIELQNLGTGPIDLDGFQLGDDGLENRPESFLEALPATDVHGSDATLGPGEVALVWLNDSAPAADGTPDLEFRLGLPNQYLNTNDDVWLIDPAGNLVDYMSWGSTGSAYIGAGPGAAFWDPAVQEALNDGSDEQSISLAIAASTDDSRCWEITGTGEATCPGAIATLDLDPAMSASAGWSNWVL